MFIVPIIAAPFYGIERLAWVTGICLAIGVIAALIYAIVIKVYDKLEKSVLQELDYPNWEFVPKADAYVTVKSRQTLDKYDSIRIIFGSTSFMISSRLIPLSGSENTTPL